MLHMDRAPPMSIEKLSKVSHKYDQIFKRSSLQALKEKISNLKKKPKEDTHFEEKIKQQRLRKLDFL